MSTPTTQDWAHLAPKPGSAYRQLFVKGTRIMARILYGLAVNEDEPMTPEEIAAEYGLPLEAVREAIAYCRSDPPEIREDWEREQALMDASGMNAPGYREHGRPAPLSPEEMTRLLRR